MGRKRPLSVVTYEHSSLDELIGEVSGNLSKRDAHLYGDPFLPSLAQTTDEIATLIEDPSSLVLVARLGHRLVGSVRASVDGNTARVSRLMTAPDIQGLGIGRQLMTSIEAALDSEHIQLSTGSLSTSNLSFYGRLGYRTIRTNTLDNDVSIITMNKTRETVGCAL